MYPSKTLVRMVFFLHFMDEIMAVSLSCLLQCLTIGKWQTCDPNSFGLNLPEVGSPDWLYVRSM